MNYVYDVQAVKEAEAWTMEKLNISEVELMKKAGTELTADFLSRVKPEKTARILIVASTGNNGGDSLVMYNKLKQEGFDPKLVVLGDLAKASTSFKHYFAKIKKYENIDTGNRIGEFEKFVKATDILIDGIFGLGLSRNVEGIYAQAIDIINDNRLTVYSIDIPSGISPENGLVLNKAIKADYTGVLGLLKIGNLINDALDYHGHWQLLDIGIEPRVSSKIKYVDYHEIDISPKARFNNSHKYTYGYGLFFGGDQGMTGSIQMSALAALRSGMGIAKVVSATALESMNRFYPEILYQSIKAPEEIDADIQKASSAVFGPGMKPGAKLFGQILDQLISQNIPVLIDAGGFKYLDEKQPGKSKIVLTPHQGELTRIFAVKPAQIVREPFTYIAKLTDRGFTVLLKGPATIIADNNQIFISQAINPGLAKAGTGDVLSGMIGAYLSGFAPIEACLRGFALHCLAGQKARQAKTVYSILPTDIIDQISEVFKERL